MTKEKKEVMSPKDRALMEKLKANSGENENIKSSFIPYLEVDNSDEHETVNGRKVKVKVKPRFKVTEKVDGEYVTNVYKEKFDGVVLKYKHQIRRKYKQDSSGKNINKHPFFRSYEFTSFRDNIVIKYNGKDMHPRTYQEWKEYFGDEMELWGIVYIYILKEDAIKKLELKGASRGVMFDYVAADKPYSMSAIVTVFSAELVEGSVDYNRLVVNTGNKLYKDLEAISRMQEEVEQAIHKPKFFDDTPIMGEVEPADTAGGNDNEINIDNIPF